MPSITEKPWILALCIPVVILGVGGGMCYLLLHQLTSSHASEVHAHWKYEGAEGPDHWGALSPDWAIASTGIRQSPIDINTSAAVAPAQLGKDDLLGPIKFHYAGSMLEVINTGHTIQVNCSSTADNYIEISGQKYELLQFHLHTPSEHKIDGKDYPMELHLVHQLIESSEDKAELKPVKLAVVGVMIKEGEINKIIEKLGHSDILTSETGDDPYNVLIKEFRADAFLPPEGKRSYYRYHGSLTTPPCSENVLWTVMENPISFSKTQIDIFTKKYKGNRRPVQGAFHRLIMRYSDGSGSSSATAAPSTSPINSASSFVVPVQSSGIQ